MKAAHVIDPEHELARRHAPTDLGPLFNQPPAPERPRSVPMQPRLHHHLDTSQAKEARLRRTGGTIAGRVLAYLVENGAHTRRELSQLLAIDISTMCPTVDALRKDGRIVELEEKRNGGHLLRASCG